MATKRRSDDDEFPNLRRLRVDIAAGDMRDAREALKALTPDEWEELELRLGKPAADKLRGIERSRKRGLRGRVVVIHGIMGGKLCTRDAKGDVDHVWLNYVRLALGHIARFRLDAAGNQADPSMEVFTAGLLDEYLPLVFELDGTWEVLPFSFDWRIDVGRSADALDRAIREFAGGKPCHIVAHSMGGLVARHFMQKHPGTWRSMADPNGLASGGRLVMLGTPNRGSFAIPFVLTGEEQTVKLLGKLDQKHKLPQLLDIINTFVGTYQMLPSPLHQFGDDRLRLYKQSSWGSLPVSQRRLDAGREFQQNLDSVIDPERLVYVAGYDQDTPFRIRVDGPGAFSYQTTREGDGRVPHELGVLPGVKTYYVPEVHGDLPSNERILDAIHDLLTTGNTTRLETRVPGATRAIRSAPFQKARDIAPLPPAVAGLLVPTTRSFPKPQDASLTTRILIEQAIVEPFVGASRTSRVKATPSSPPPVPGPRRKPRRLDIEVLWADILEADGEVYVAGHYQGVVPQFGELALDRVVSGQPKEGEHSTRDLVITAATRRGQIRGAVGDVNFYPWKVLPCKTVAIAGMGQSGSFGKRELQRLVRGVTEQVSMLPGVQIVNTLMIGAGVGNLPIAAAAEGMVNGLLDAINGDAMGASEARIRIVERDRPKAESILAALLKLKRTRGADLEALNIVPRVQRGRGGTYNDRFILSAALAAVRKHLKRDGARAEEVVKLLPAAVRKLVLEEQRRLLELVDDVPSGSGREGRMPSRFVFTRIEEGLRASAISHSAVVPERVVPLDWGLLDDLIVRMTEPPDPEAIAQDAALLANLVIPQDFRAEILRCDSTIFEVDRDTARIPWEILGRLDEGTSTAEPMALSGQVSRQLRTQYSPPPSRDPPPSKPLRALVIGDPGTGDHALPNAREEAIAVDRIMRDCGIEVTTLIGPPDLEGKGEHPEFAPATILNVLRELGKQYDILHFAGHADFQRAAPDRAGWVFGDLQFLTARELAAAWRIPRLVVANACITGALSVPDKSGVEPVPERVRESRLLPGLADEFFKRGVRNYIGTAWAINTQGAVGFSRVLYTELLENGESIGEALFRARGALRKAESTYPALWAAYRHYGEPTITLMEGSPTTPARKGANKGGGA